MKTAAAVLLLALTLPGWAADRSRAERAAFQRQEPCPSTGLRRGPCPGFEVDHAIPLCAGGRDHRANLHWLRTEDHAFKTRIDVRECRRARRAAANGS